ncbi:MAG: phosphatidylglycerol lysyltransferase domain-containing protein [bacterium]
MVPEFPNFRPLELADRLWLGRHLRHHHPTVCELNLGNLYIWQDFDKPRIACLNKNFCILISPDNELPYFLEPLGNNKLEETIEILLKHTPRLSRVNENFINKLPANKSPHQNLSASGGVFWCGDKYKVHALRSQFDYLFTTIELAQLKGRKYDGKRNHIKRFIKHFSDHKFIPLLPDHFDPALKLFEKWFAVRSESRFFPKLAHTAQKKAITKAFENYSELKFIGGALLSGDKLLGFTLGSPLNSETASVHFAYGDPDAPGVAQTLLWEACNKTFSGFKYVNLEQDLGIPGLRTAKLSYHPLKLVEKFEVGRLVS